MSPLQQQVLIFALPNKNKTCELSDIPEAAGEVSRMVSNLVLCEDKYFEGKYINYIQQRILW